MTETKARKKKCSYYVIRTVEKSRCTQRASSNNKSCILRVCEINMTVTVCVCYY